MIRSVAIFAALLLGALPLPLFARHTVHVPVPTQHADASLYVAALPPSPPITTYAPPKPEYEKAVAYSAGTYLHSLVNALYGLLVLFLILQFRLAVRYRDFAARVSRRRFVQFLLYAAAILITLALFSLPSDLWDHSLSRRFGLSIQSWSSWFSDWVVNGLVLLIVEIILVTILYFLIRHSPRRWWFYFWMATIPVLLAAFFLQPLVVEPLFFTFTPLEATHPELVTQIQQIALHGGIEIPAARIFEMNASSKFTEGSAYVTGFGASKRAVIADNTLQQLTMPETLFVFSHEMGHYALQHIPKEIAMSALLLLALSWLGFRLASWTLARWGSRWKIPALEDWASLPLLLLVGTTIVLLSTPLFNAMSRYFEHEADRYALEVIHGVVTDPGQVAASTFLKTGEQNLADPNPSPLAKFLFFDHPTRPERVHFVVTYNPWSPGHSPTYVR